MLLRMHIERWASWCRGRWPLLLGVAALVLDLSGEWLLGGGCMYTMHPDGTAVSHGGAFQPETSEARAAYRLLVQLRTVTYLPLAALWLVVLTPVLWSRVVGSARIVFALTLVAAVPWVLMLAQQVLAYLYIWLKLESGPSYGLMDAEFIADYWAAKALPLATWLRVLGIIAALIRGLHTWVTSGPGQVQA